MADPLRSSFKEAICVRPSGAAAQATFMLKASIFAAAMGLKAFSEIISNARIAPVALSIRALAMRYF